MICKNCKNYYIWKNKGKLFRSVKVDKDLKETGNYSGDICKVHINPISYAIQNKELKCDTFELFSMYDLMKLKSKKQIKMVRNRAFRDI